jgi:hypothetical protein
VIGLFGVKEPGESPRWIKTEIKDKDRDKDKCPQGFFENG